MLFLVAAAVTSRFGDEQGLVVPEGESLTVQNIGTRDLLLVKNLDFEAPGFETGRPTDFTTDLAVYQNGDEVARKTIRVNDPLSVGGYTFHQNGFGPAPHLVIRDTSGAPLWDAKVPLTGAAGGAPYETMAVPGRDLGLQLLLGRNDVGEGVARRAAVPDRRHERRRHRPGRELRSGPSATRRRKGLRSARDFSIGLPDFGEYTLLIAKRDPGQGIVWAAFRVSSPASRSRSTDRGVGSGPGCTPDGQLGLVFRADRYVDVEREFGSLLDDLVAARRPALIAA